MNPATLPLPLPPQQPQEVERLTAGQWQALLEAPATLALPWMQAAAALGHAGAQAVLGQWLLDGHGTTADAPAALASFLKAAGQGHAMGMNMAGRCYENGWGTPADPQAAVRWFRQAADRGLDAGLYNLANQFAAGTGVLRSDAQALVLYQRAAAMGHAKSWTKAGRHHEEGLATPRDAEQALEHYRRGAEGGDFRGQYHYARMLAERGRMEEALPWLRRVPATATPRFLEEAGRLLAASPDARVRAVSDEMLARAAAASADSSADTGPLDGEPA
ncbi:sel1 repeat family protein [Xylophilus rhododendri]|uniref:Sel1 repeat family protein n=1 Tax=Xylophilus rhododendri TaxID=2697032 RepID=A0A857JCB8_9BURK|nr:tetratricopeptide repeat protein [Xylophilus rhododendri]QHJ00336.1 sel1 repeat family protein [Xylophilus rhododendri]